MSTWRIKLLYDGSCPFCRREVGLLSRFDRRDRIALEDIAQPSFDPQVYGLTLVEVQSKFHSVLPDGSILVGPAAMRRALKAIGFGWLAAPTGWPILRPLFDRAYVTYARWRVPVGRWFGRKCDSGSCAIHHK